MKLCDFTGQDHVKPVLTAEIDASKTTAMRHCLLFGQSGLGKTTLAKTLAFELGYHFWPVSPWEVKDATTFLLRLPVTGYDRAGMAGAGAVRHLVFVDECHKMTGFEEWYEPLQEGHAVHNGSVSWLPYFTFVGATNKPETLPKPFVDRCPLQFTLRPYSVDEYARIVRGRFPKMTESQAKDVGRRARGSARVALAHAESVLNFGPGYFEQVGIDERGLTDMDRSYLEALRKSKGGMSLSSVAAVTGLPAATVAETVEPYLLSLGLVEIVPGRGRMLTEPGRGERGMLQQLIKP